MQIFGLHFDSNWWRTVAIFCVEDIQVNISVCMVYVVYSMKEDSLQELQTYLIKEKVLRHIYYKRSFGEFFSTEYCMDGDLSVLCSDEDYSSTSTLPSNSQSAVKIVYICKREEENMLPPSPKQKQKCHQN